MNWKQVIFTALITLFVTIISGVIVNWYTTEKLGVVKSENLVYSVRDIPRFKSDSLNISLFAFEVINIGELKSEKIDIQIDFGHSAEIMDVTNTLERTKESLSPISITKNRINFNVSSLFTQDKFTINVALKNLTDVPMIVVQSQNSIGKPLKLNDSKSETESKPFTWFLIILLTFFLLTPTLYLFTRVFRRFTGYPENLNNTAFLSIHNRQYGLAEELLTLAIRKDGGSTNEFANYALVKCLKQENRETYESLIRMAEFVSKSKQDNLVLSFNKLIIAAYTKDYNNISKEFELAVKLNKKEFTKYFQYSQVLKELRQLDNVLNEKLKELENRFHV